MKTLWLAVLLALPAAALDDNALEQSIRLSVDSGVIFRGIAEVERALVVVEEIGWAAARTAVGRERAPQMPPFVLELGENLLALKAKQQHEGGEQRGQRWQVQARERTLQRGCPTALQELRAPPLCGHHRDDYI